MDRWGLMWNTDQDYVDMEQMDDGDYVLYTDHIAALEEKDRRIKELEEEVKFWSAVGVAEPTAPTPAPHE